VNFSGWCLWLTVISTRFIHVFLCIISFFLIAEYCEYIHSYIDFHLGCFQFGAIMTKDSMNIFVQACFVDTQFHLF